MFGDGDLGGVKEKRSLEREKTAMDHHQMKNVLGFELLILILVVLPRDFGLGNAGMPGPRTIRQRPIIVGKITL